MTLNHEQKFAKDWKYFINAGTMENKLNQNVMYRFSAITLLNDAGDFILEQQQTTTPQKAHYLQLGVSGKLRAGITEHDLTLAVDRAWRERSAAKAAGRISNLGTGNIYSGLINQIRAPHTDYEPYLANKTKTKGLSFVDSITVNKWNALLGIHYHSSDATTYNTAGRTTSRVIASATTPTYALTYRPTDKISVYGSHAEYFESGTIVGSAYHNNNAILPPAKTKQNEIGVKYANRDMLYTLAFFDIEQANNIRVDRGGLAYLEQNGKLRHRGIELGIAGKIAPKWSLAFGAAYMDAFYDKTAGGTRDGVTEDGQPRWNGTLMASYAADNKFSAFARMTYTGGAYILYEKFKSPSTTVLDLGMTYRTNFGSVPATIGLTIYNALNKEYWMVSRDNNNIYLSTPRTIALSVAMDL
jgi:putative tonB-dependent receptor